MGLIAKIRLKLPSGLTVVQRDYPISAHTVTRSTAHIKGSKMGVHTIPRDRVEEEGGDREIHFCTRVFSTTILLSTSTRTR